MAPDERGTDEAGSGKRPGGAPGSAPGRDQRRAAALRANLQRRKAQIRGRSEDAASERVNGPDEPKSDR